MFRSRQFRVRKAARGGRGRPLGVESLEARHLLAAVALAGDAHVAEAASHLSAAAQAAIGVADVNAPSDFSGTGLSGSTIDLTWTPDGTHRAI